MISSLASLYGGQQMSQAAERAAELYTQQADRALQLQREMYREGVARQAPFLEQGTQAFNRLVGLQTGGPEAAQNFLQMDPGYGFRLSEGLKVEGFARLRFTVERERRRHRDPVQALLPVMLTYRSFALANRALFGVMFGNALPQHVPTEYSRQQARLALGAVESAVAEARAALGAGPDDAREAAVRLWAAVHGPVTLEVEGITPFDRDGERLARLAVTDVLASLRLNQPGAATSLEKTP